MTSLRAELSESLSRHHVDLDLALSEAEIGDLCRDIEYLRRSSTHPRDTIVRAYAALVAPQVREGQRRPSMVFFALVLDVSTAWGANPCSVVEFVNAAFVDQLRSEEEQR